MRGLLILSTRPRSASWYLIPDKNNLLYTVSHPKKGKKRIGLSKNAFDAKHAKVSDFIYFLFF